MSGGPWECKYVEAPVAAAWPPVCSTPYPLFHRAGRPADDRRPFGHTTLECLEATGGILVVTLTEPIEAVQNARIAAVVDVTVGEHVQARRQRPDAQPLGAFDYDHPFTVAAKEIAAGVAPRSKVLHGQVHCLPGGGATKQFAG